MIIRDLKRCSRSEKSEADLRCRRRTSASHWRVAAWGLEGVGRHYAFLGTGEDGNRLHRLPFLWLYGPS